MIATEPFELALIAAAVLAVIEVLTGTFIFLGFSIGCLAVAGLEAWTKTFSLGRDALVFSALALVVIATLRLTFGRSGDSRHSEGDVNDY